jgi:hypothetical protein
MELPVGRREGGFIMLGIASCLATWAILSGWSSYNRWTAISAAKSAAFESYLGNDSVARERAESARRYQGLAVTALAGLDLSGASGLAQLDSAAAEGSRSEQAALRKARAFATALQGGKAEEQPGTDGQLLAHIAQLNSFDGRSIPGLPPYSPGSDTPPDRAILIATLERRLKVAWAVGDLKALHEASAMLGPLAPRHPARVYTELLQGLLAGESRQQLDNRLRAASDEQVRSAILRAAAVAKPPVASLALNLLPPSQRSGQELVSAMLMSNAKPEDIVAAARVTPEPGVLTAVASHCLALERLDLVDQLGKLGTPEFNKAAQTVIALRSWDLPALKSLGLDPTTVQPRVIGLTGGFGWVSFHVVDSMGDPPRVGLEIDINGKRIAAQDIVRMSSLVRISAPGVGRVRISLAIRGVTFFDRELER